MEHSLSIYNTLTRRKEQFVPLHPPFVGLYVCGPTVYGPAHMGHARSAIAFDVLIRYLQHRGYKVKYVRNITDVGHLERDADEGEDKIEKQARLEQLEPMEVAQRYLDSYHDDMDALNIQRPSIEPRASGHIIEQIELIKRLLAQGMAYEVEGSVYFDVAAYQKKHNYGILSGRSTEDQLAGSRMLIGQIEKRNALDFALWKNASITHLMRWPSPWGEGFPGWHLECSVMSGKYLGCPFDIHGGGMDLCFPHHECEIAQTQAAYQQGPAKYWLHNNLVTIEDQKMGKSLGNFITLKQLFTGNHTLLDSAYTPMTLRFFILQAHYRSPVRFSAEALKAAHKGYLKLINAAYALANMSYGLDEAVPVNPQQVRPIEEEITACYESMNDDLNTAKTIAALFGLTKYIHALQEGSLKPAELGPEGFSRLRDTYLCFVHDILGLRLEASASSEAYIEAMVEVYRLAKQQQQYNQVDHIRQLLRRLGVTLQDGKGYVHWRYEAF